jgi:hypothetical protein
MKSDMVVASPTAARFVIVTPNDTLHLTADVLTVATATIGG